MATAIGKTPCVTCGKDKVAYRCEGCSQAFCFNHLAEHRQELGLRLDAADHQRNLLRQTITELVKNPQRHVLIQQINQWEKDSIDLIRQTAEEARLLLVKHAVQHIDKIEVKLAKLTEELKTMRDENDFHEFHLNLLMQKLQRLEERLNKPSNISIQYDSSSFVNRIYVVVSSLRLSVPNINAESIWARNGITVAGGNGGGRALNQLSLPFGVYVDDEQTIYVADQSNHRIVEWKNGAISGQVVAGGNGAGEQNNQLNCPVSVFVDEENDSLIICDRGNKRVVRWSRQNTTNGETIISNIDCWDLKMDNNGHLYVADGSRNEVRRYGIGDITGTVVAGGNEAGSRLDQLKQPYHICVDQDYSVYISDNYNYRVVKWVNGAREGVLIPDDQGQTNGLTLLANPRGIAVDQLGTVYVVDLDTSRVIRWCKETIQGTIVVGGNGQGGQANQFCNPTCLSFDRQNNLYVVDTSNQRIQKFNIETN